MWMPLILALVAIQRMGELGLARRNTTRLKADGGIEVGAGHYPLFVLLHASWLAVLVVLTPWTTVPNPWLIGVFVLLQLGRVWVIATLGRYWTTRIITVPGAPLVRRGPYRFVRHPNYWIASLELAVLPLAFGQIWIALVWSLANALLVRHRVRVEESALSERDGC
ncbi:isoprenylcysteine carboxylmethyltransferase family protein [uncultured Brevundimonas sp.]|uniref:isoprenylcysteine carboxyl methyltransferase family protein n=1 Tax=uncultured Brevundimonas sp. TaxID=213418 RepID=UPI0030ECEF96|tara:strand:+ start:2919 stop:3416 length:498 start_codon:yes stop_codon:yes gene_type:complete